MRRRIQRAARDRTAVQAQAPSRSPQPLAAHLLALQRQAGNRAVAGALTAQRACDYDPRERAAMAAGRGILGSDVMMLSSTGSGYNAASNSVVVADFPPGSASLSGGAASELRGTWKGILERAGAPQVALLGFTDCYGDEVKNKKLRGDRARAVAGALPNTAKRASVIGAAPADDFLLPGNATPTERAMNRSVLLRLPPEELRQSVEVDEYSAAAVNFWRANPGATVDALIDAVAKEAGALLDRNGVYKPDVIKAKVKFESTLAYFYAKEWTVTVDEQKMAADLAQKGVTAATKLSELKLDAIAALASNIYHEFRHAEQAFLAARMLAEEAKGAMDPKDLARELDIPLEAASAAVAMTNTRMPDKLKTQARAWRTTQQGGRYIEYKGWNDALNQGLGLFLSTVKWDDLLKKDPGLIQVNWENFLHPVIDPTFRRNYSWKGDDLGRRMKAGSRHEQVDDDVMKAFTETSAKLFSALAKEQQGRKLPTPAEIAKMDRTDAQLAHLAEQIWLQELQLAFMDARAAADAAYRAYPGEADAYQTQDLVKESIKEHGGP